MDTRLSLKQLADAAGVTPRTVRYYVSEGLLPSPERGPQARYDPAHLARLRLIRQLQRNHLPLAEIRRRLTQLSDADVSDLLRSEPPVKDSAIEYVRAALAEPTRFAMGRPTPSPAASFARRIAAEPTPAASTEPDRSHWERVSLSPEVELHIRRPLTRGQNQAVSRLIDQAREILEEETP
jgi:DNA-binding transcriptional MerR regulator